MPTEVNVPLDKEDNVVRAIFSPLMLNMQGMISKNAFALRHHEDYISVNRTSVASWQQDIDAIPQNNNRVLCGYGQMNVGRIQAQGFTMDGESVEFQVYARHSSDNKSHAGIFSYLSGQKLIGDKTPFTNISLIMSVLTGCHSLYA